MKDKIKLIIAMPCTDMMVARTGHSIASAIIGNPCIVDFLMWQGCDVAGARTWLVNEAIKKGGTHILFVDSDMLFHSDTIKQLLSHDKDIVGVQCHKRKFPLEKVAVPLTEFSESKTKLFKCALLGTGILLIKLSVFEKLKLPWFNFGRDKKGELVVGEDAWFCYTAIDSGFDLWCDPTIKVGHVGLYTY